jgi:hypothetical protein
MKPGPPEKSLLSNPLLAVAILPLAVGFIIAASLSAGPSEVFKALTGRK